MLGRMLVGCLMAGLGVALAAGPDMRIVTIASEPFGFETAAGKGGMMYEIGNRIALAAGMRAENRIEPYARTVESLKAGSADMVLRFSNEELATVAHQVAPVVRLDTMVIGREDSPCESLTDLVGKTVAMARSFPGSRQILDQPGIHVYLVDSNEHAVRMLFAKRVDAVLGSDLGVFGAAGKLGYPRAAFGKPIMLEPNWFWLHYARKTASKQRLRLLKTTVDTLARQGVFEDILQNYRRAAGW